MPFGFPVVPEVKAISTTSSAAVSTAANPAGFVTARRSSSSSSPAPWNVITFTSWSTRPTAVSSSSRRRTSQSAMVTFARSRTFWSSPARRSGIVATTIPPAFATANQSAIMSGLFAARSSTRPPGTSPRSSTRTCANRSTRSENSR